MTKLPSLTGKSILKKLGFEIKRQKRSHFFFNILMEELQLFLFILVKQSVPG